VSILATIALDRSLGRQFSPKLAQVATRKDQRELKNHEIMRVMVSGGKLVGSISKRAMRPNNATGLMTSSTR
jgi:molecular chaperone GrpE (heat shock protein)